MLDAALPMKDLLFPLPPALLSMSMVMLDISPSLTAAVSMADGVEELASCTVAKFERKCSRGTTGLDSFPGPSKSDCIDVFLATVLMLFSD